MKKDNIELFIDDWGRGWRLPKNELCPECGQPDNCGDCNHNKIPDNMAEDLGAILVGKRKEEKCK